MSITNPIIDEWNQPNGQATGELDAVFAITRRREQFPALSRAERDANNRVRAWALRLVEVANREQTPDVIGAKLHADAKLREALDDYAQALADLLAGEHLV